jgi:hypothetical protein
MIELIYESKDIDMIMDKFESLKEKLNFFKDKRDINYEIDLLIKQDNNILKINVNDGQEAVHTTKRFIFEEHASNRSNRGDSKQSVWVDVSNV